MSRASSDVDKKHPQSLKKIQLKLYEELRLQDWTHFVMDSQMDGRTDKRTH